MPHRLLGTLPVRVLLNTRNVFSDDSEPSDGCRLPVSTLPSRYKACNDVSCDRVVGIGPEIALVSRSNSVRDVSPPRLDEIVPVSPTAFRVMDTTWPVALQVTYVPQLDVAPEHTVEMSGSWPSQVHWGRLEATARALDKSHRMASWGRADACMGDKEGILLGDTGTELGVVVGG